MALRQNDPKFALSLINNTSTYVSVRFIQLIAFTQLKEFDKAFEVLHRTIEGYKLSGSSNKPHFGKEMLEDLQKSIKISGSEEALSKYSEIYRELELLDLINDDVSFKVRFVLEMTISTPHFNLVFLSTFYRPCQNDYVLPFRQCCQRIYSIN